MTDVPTVPPGFLNNLVVGTRDPAPTATLLPTLTQPPAPLLWVRRPSSPSILSVEADYGVKGKVTVQLSSSYSGHLQYRVFHATVYRPSDAPDRVPWISRYVPPGSGGELNIYNLEVLYVWEFEVRAVEGGITGNPSGSYIMELWDPSSPGIK